MKSDSTFVDIQVSLLCKYYPDNTDKITYQKLYPLELSFFKDYLVFFLEFVLDLFVTNQKKINYFLIFLVLKINNIKLPNNVRMKNYSLFTGFLRVKESDEKVIKVIKNQL